MLTLRYISPVNLPKLRTYVNDLPRNVDNVVKESASRIQKGGKSRARRKTGTMAAGIVIKKIRNGYLVYASVNYSRWQEEGTSRGISPNKFMHDSMIEESGKLKSGHGLDKLKFK